MDYYVLAGSYSTLTDAESNLSFLGRQYRKRNPVIMQKRFQKVYISMHQANCYTYYYSYSCYYCPKNEVSKLPEYTQ